MKKISFLFLAVILLSFTGCQKDDLVVVSSTTDDIVSLQKSGDIIDGQYIVIFNEKAPGLKSKNWLF